MFLRYKVRRKDGKEHRYWSIVENRRVSGGRTVQRQVLYLGEINDGQKAAWCRTIEAFDEAGQDPRQIALFPEDRPAPVLDCDVVHVRLSGLRLHRPRQWGACWLACHLWDQRGGLDVVQSGLGKRLDQPDFIGGTDRAGFDLKALARAFLVDVDMFREVGHRLPALLNARTIFRRRGQRKGAQGWSIIAPAVGGRRTS